MKRGPLPFLRLDPDSSAVTFDDLFANRQSDARPRIFFPGVQPLEDDKDAFKVLLRNADAIIAHGKMPATRLLLHADPNLQRPFTAELNRIADEVLKKLHQLDAIAGNSRKLRAINLCSALLDGHGEISQ